jgi:hexosaminidase
MVWVYAEEPYRFVPSYNWDRLAEVFPTAWTSSAFKGADGPTSTVPDIQKRLQNNLNWLQLMGLEEEKFKEGFRGIALTGWQRYDHFAVLAELLPVGIPSLAVNLLTVTHGFFNESLKSELYKRLDCADGSHLYESFIDLEADPYLWDKMAWCFFPGSQMFKLTRNLENVQVEVSNYLSKSQVEQGWMTDYNVRRNYSSPMRVEESMEDMPRVHFSVTNLIRHAQSALGEVYDDFTVGEWIEQKIYPMLTELAKMKKNAASLKKEKHWPSRPLPILPELREFGVGIPRAPKTSVEAKNTNSDPIVMQPVDQAPPVVYKSADPPDSSQITVRPKRLVQAPDFYRHPPGSFQSEKL